METTSRTEAPERRSLIGLFSDLWRETSALFRAEAELAKAELSEKVSQATAGVTSLAIGGLVAFAGLLVLLDAAVYGVTALLSILALATAQVER